MNAETIKALASALAIIVVNIATWAGYALDADLVLQIIASVMALVALCWGIWNNFNFTEAAQQMQQMLCILKADHEDRSDGEAEEAQG